jgi:hypothetical protein
MPRYGFLYNAAWGPVGYRQDRPGSSAPPAPVAPAWGVAASAGPALLRTLVDLWSCNGGEVEAWSWS